MCCVSDRPGSASTPSCEKSGLVSAHVRAGKLVEAGVGQTLLAGWAFRFSGWGLVARRAAQTRREQGDCWAMQSSPQRQRTWVPSVCPPGPLHIAFIWIHPSLACSTLKEEA